MVGTLQIVSSVAPDQFLINGQIYTSPVGLQFVLSPGVYSLVLKASGYEDFSTSFTIADNSTTFVTAVWVPVSVPSPDTFFLSVNQDLWLQLWYATAVIPNTTYDVIKSVSAAGDLTEAYLVSLIGADLTATIMEDKPLDPCPEGYRRFEDLTCGPFEVPPEDEGKFIFDSTQPYTLDCDAGTLWQYSNVTNQWYVYSTDLNVPSSMFVSPESWAALCEGGVPLPPGEWQVINAPPADYNPAFLPSLHLLDDALASGDLNSVLNVLKTEGLRTGSVVTFLASLAAITLANTTTVQALWPHIVQFVGNLTLPKILSYVAAILGSYVFAGFLHEEAMQTMNFATYQAQQNELWPEAQDLIDRRRAILEAGIWNDFYDVIPGLNTIAAVEDYYAADLSKLEIDALVNAQNLKTLAVPSAGNVQQYIIAKETGIDPTPYAPSASSTLTIYSNVPAAAVEVDGTGWSTLLPFKLGVNKGTHEITIKADGYHDRTSTLNVSTPDTGVTLNLTPLSEVPPEEPTEPTDPGTQPVQEVTIQLDPVTYNAWRYDVKAVDAVTGEELNAQLLVNDIAQQFATPTWVYLAPVAIYNFKVRKVGYRQGEVNITTPPLPT